MSSYNINSQTLNTICSKEPNFEIEANSSNNFITEKSSVPLHIQNPFLYPSKNLQISNKTRRSAQSRPLPYYRTLSLPSSNKKFENLEKAYNLVAVETALLKHTEDPIDIIFKSLTSKNPKTEDLLGVYFSEPEDMSKTTLNWKNSFASMRDRFGNNNEKYSIIYTNVNNQETSSGNNNFSNNELHGSNNEQINSYTLPRRASLNKSQSSDFEKQKNDSLR